MRFSITGRRWAFASAGAMIACLVLAASAQVRVTVLNDGTCGPPADPEAFMGPIYRVEIVDVTLSAPAPVPAIAATPEPPPVEAAPAPKPRGRFTSLGAGDPLGHQIKDRKKRQQPQNEIVRQ